MEKYGVVQNPEKVETQKQASAGNSGLAYCPLCGSPLTPVSSGFHCPQHGTLPFEMVSRAPERSKPR